MSRRFEKNEETGASEAPVSFVVMVLLRIFAASSAVRAAGAFSGTGAFFSVPYKYGNCGGYY